MPAKEQTKNRVAIAGQVIDAETKLAIAGACVEITNQRDSKIGSICTLSSMVRFGKRWLSVLTKL